MTTRLLVHGVPETARIWDGVVAALDGDVRTLPLPGFGNVAPDGFDRTMDAYLDWLLGEIDAVGGPVDLVGHDWGGILTARVATLGPPNLRSWATDAPGSLSPKFEWHDTAKVWITPGAGEDFFAMMLGDLEGSAALLGAFGLGIDNAREMVSHIDQEMVDSILALYRSSDGRLGTAWVADGHTSTPGLVIGSADDPLLSVHVARAMADELGAGLAVLEHGGHFWPVEAADDAAQVLTAFWASLD